MKYIHSFLEIQKCCFQYVKKVYHRLVEFDAVF